MRYVAMFSVFLCVPYVCFGHQGHHAAGTPAAVTITGEVIDPICYLSHEEKGAEHAACAQDCLDNGTPPALLTDDGRVITVLPTHESHKAYDAIRRNGAKKVKIKGQLLKRGGLTAIAATTVTSLDGKDLVAAEPQVPGASASPAGSGNTSTAH